MNHDWPDNQDQPDDQRRRASGEATGRFPSAVVSGDVGALPSVAVIVPCYNAEGHVARALNSIVDQQYPRLEVIAVDDGSTDRTLAVLNKFNERIRVETGSNHGACAARNRGLSSTTADYVLFFDADDYIEGELIRGLAEVAGQKRADFVIGRSCIEHEDGRRSGMSVYNNGLSNLQIARRWAAGEYVQTGALLWRSEFLRTLGGWNEQVRRGQDIELVLRTLPSAKQIAVSSEGLAIWTENSSVFRISQDYSLPALESQLYYLEEAALRYNAVDCEVTRLLAIQIYNMARSAYRTQRTDFGDRCLSAARDLGLSGNPGSIAHKIGCGVLGLRRKELAVRSLSALNRYE